MHQRVYILLVWVSPEADWVLESKWQSHAPRCKNLIAIYSICSRATAIVQTIMNEQKLKAVDQIKPVAVMSTFNFLVQKSFRENKVETVSAVVWQLATVVHINNRVNKLARCWGKEAVVEWTQRMIMKIFENVCSLGAYRLRLRIEPMKAQF